MWLLFTLFGTGTFIFAQGLRNSKRRHKLLETIFIIAVLCMLNLAAMYIVIQINRLPDMEDLTQRTGYSLPNSQWHALPQDETETTEVKELLYDINMLYTVNNSYYPQESSLPKKNYQFP